MSAARATGRNVAAAALLSLFCVVVGACDGTSYVVPPADASAMDDPDWVIKHEPKPAEPVAQAESTAAPTAEPASAPSPPAEKP